MSKLFTKRTKRLLITAILLLLIGLIPQKENIKPIIQKAEENQPGLYTVKVVSDGDTISVDMNGVVEKVRFIGVDTPETNDPRKEVQCFGKAASEFTKKLIGENTVRLEADPTNTNRDRYNRLLRYVYLPNGTLVNAEIIKNGYGFAYTNFPFTKLDEFKKYQEDAKRKNLGLWGSCSVTTESNGQNQTQDNQN